MLKATNKMTKQNVRVPALFYIQTHLKGVNLKNTRDHRVTNKWSKLYYEKRKPYVNNINPVIIHT